MALDINNFSMGEIALIESLSKQSISVLERDESPKGNMLAALALIAKRRTGHPSFTWNEAQALTMADVTELLGLDDDEEDEDADPLDDSTPSD